MNLFYLDCDIDQSVRYHCDKHVVKMCLETAQLLCTALRSYQLFALYKATQANHPTTRWTGDSLRHYEWLTLFGLALCKEYTWRYCKEHASESVIRSLPKAPAFPDEGWREPPQAMPDEFKGPDCVAAYRKFYTVKKRPFATWTKRPVPPFMR